MMDTISMNSKAATETPGLRSPLAATETPGLLSARDGTSVSSSNVVVTTMGGDTKDSMTPVELSPTNTASGAPPGEDGASVDGAPGEDGVSVNGAPGEDGASVNGAPGEDGASVDGAPGEDVEAAAEEQTPISQRSAKTFSWDNSPYTQHITSHSVVQPPQVIPGSAEYPIFETSKHRKRRAVTGDHVNPRDVRKSRASHHSTFYGLVPPKKVKGLLDFAESDEESDDEGFLDEPISSSEVISNIGFSSTSNPSQTELTEGLKQTINISSANVSERFQTGFDVFIFAVCLLNVGVAIYELMEQFQSTEEVSGDDVALKVSVLLLVLMEMCIPIASFIIRKQTRCHSASTREKMIKHIQIVESGLGELLFAPLLGLSVIDIAGGDPGSLSINNIDASDALQLSIIIIDVVTIIGTQWYKLSTMYKLVTDMRHLIDKTVEQLNENSWTIACRLFPRFLPMMIGNFILLLTIAIALGNQVYTDTQNGETQLQVESIILLVFLIFFPWLNVIMFIVANLFWVVEVIMHVTVASAKDQGYQQDMLNKYGHTVAETFSYTQRRLPVTQKRLDVILKTSKIKKLFSSLLEPHFAILFCIAFWFLVAMTIVCKANYVIIFIWLSLLFNWQALLLMVVSNVFVLIIFIIIFLYPIAIQLWKRLKKRNIKSDIGSLIKADA